MNESRADSDVSLPEFLSGRARRASDARLALDVACGFVVALAAVFWRGPAWLVIASGAVCVLAYGTWGILDREINERAARSPDRHPALHAGRGAAALAGAIATVILGMSGLFLLLGKIKS